MTRKASIPSVLSAIAPTVLPGRILDGRWVLESVYWVSRNRLRFQVGDWGPCAFGLDVINRNDASPSFRCSPAHSWVHVALRGPDPMERDDSAQRAADRIVNTWTAVDPHIGSVGQQASDTVGERAARKVNITLHGDCNAKCDFCPRSNRDLPAPLFDDAYHQKWVDELVRARAEGCSWVRIHGSEPLVYPRILELAHLAVELGYSSATVNTTGKPFADRHFTAELLAALPTRHAISIPLYGSTSEPHERVTKHANSFSAALKGIENVLERLGPKGQVGISTVILPVNLTEIPKIRSLADRLGVPFEAHMPYPDAEPEIYEGVSTRLSHVVRTLHSVQPPIPVLEAPPCVLARHELAHSIPSFTDLLGCSANDDWPALLDTLAREGKAGWVHENSETVACRSVSGCLLSGVCSQRILARYVDLHGHDEFIPVGPKELVHMTLARMRPRSTAVPTQT